ncbi:hypothetical protein BBJ28_00011000 [Nothophytophthora sp. Chile5]|nr:hypothetical protein BBJ28_00011000 [Nothophytophthora sp. Chile5]
MNLQAALNVMDAEGSSSLSPSATATPARADSLFVCAEELAATQTECVDVYLLRPEEAREIELKDFTIMKPKNNKMHRLVRYYPRCEISYRAVPPPPPPEEKLVTSPGGSTTTTVVVTAERTPRHNGGFSNPSRNAEIFRLKRKLLKEYFTSVRDDDREAAMFDALITGRNPHPRQQPSVSYDQRSASPSVRSLSPPPRRPLPKYKPVAVGDEESIALTSERSVRMSLDDRIRYVSALWPGLAPVDHDDDIMNYYGIEVEIITEEEREKELAKGETARSSSTSATAGSDADKQMGRSMAAPFSAENLARRDDEAKSEDAGASDSETTGPDTPSSPEMTVETRSAALQKLKDAEGDDEPKPNPIATKQDDWLVVLMKESDLVEYRKRKFAQDYLQRVKRLEKSVQHYKYTHSHDDDGERKFVQCTECLKLRPLIGGMDPNKIAEPFVCWMNWDELLASCSAPQGPLYPRAKPEPRTSSASRGGSGHATATPPHANADDFKPKKGSTTNNSSHHASGPNGGGGQHASKGGSASSHHARSGGKSNAKKPKRKASPAPAGSSEKASGANGGGNSKKAKRR